MSLFLALVTVKSSLKLYEIHQSRLIKLSHLLLNGDYEQNSSCSTSGYALQQNFRSDCKKIRILSKIPSFRHSVIRDYNSVPNNFYVRESDAPLCFDV